MSDNFTTLHYLHRSKAITAYKAARSLLHEDGMAYPAYLLLKESFVATLAYVWEDITDKSCTKKARLSNLKDSLPEVYIEGNIGVAIDNLLKLELGGISAIMVAEYEDLKFIKRNLKRLINMVFGEGNL